MQAATSSQGWVNREHCYSADSLPLEVGIKWRFVQEWSNERFVFCCCELCNFKTLQLIILRTCPQARSLTACVVSAGLPDKSPKAAKRGEFLLLDPKGQTPVSLDQGPCSPAGCHLRSNQAKRMMFNMSLSSCLLSGHSEQSPCHPLLFTYVVCFCSCFFGR